MCGFLQKHHNSQLQNETSATAVSVVLVECHEMLCEASIIQKRPKVYCRQTIFGQIKTTNYDLFELRSFIDDIKGNQIS